MDPKKLRELLAAKHAEAKALAAPWEGKDMPADVASKIASTLGEFDVLKAQLDLANRMGAGDAFLNEPGELKAAHHGWREAAPDEGSPPVDVKAWRSVKEMTPAGLAEVRFHVPLAVQVKGYEPAFEAYLRKGISHMGPNDYKTLTEGVDTAGGFLVPEDYQTEIIKKMAQQAIMRSICRKIQTSRDIAAWPRINYATDDIYTSGVRLTWTGEAPALATTHRVTDPVFGLVQIPVHTAMASMPLSNNLIEDSAFDVLGIGSDLMAEAFSLGEDNVFTNGTGANQPMGFLTEAEGNGPAAVHLTSITVPSHLGMLDLEAHLPSQYERNARWMASKASYNVLRGAQSTTAAQLLWPVSNQVGWLGQEPPTLLGYPMVKNPFMPAIATTSYSYALGDFSGYCIVDRVGLSIQRLSEIYAETNITLLLARKRVGGYCVEPYRIWLGQMSV